MHASIITALVLAAGAIASPITPNIETETKLVRRGNSCTTKNYQIMAKDWNVYLDNDASYNKQCGGGCLDNIRKYCDVVTGWGCDRDANGQAHMSFMTPAGCSNWAMTEALKDCTRKEQTIDCVYV
ncbi:hypothetical protein BFW01_g7469 [Lasiodiplodia theobromae]|nr:hypothetical protein BFW01_g7469 [Lasiodiplodia theobromae]